MSNNNKANVPKTTTNEETTTPQVKEQTMLSLEDVQKLIDNALKQQAESFKAKSKELKTAIENVSANNGVDEAVLAAEEARKAKEREEFLNEKVTIRLFKDSVKYIDDVTITYNGRNFLIKRGVEVQVPRKVAMVLSLSDKQEAEASDYIQAKQSEYQSNSNVLE